MKSLILLVLFLFAIQLSGQELLQTANQKFSNQDWAAAASDYTKYLKKNATDSSAWFNLAISQRNLREFDKAIESFGQAKKTNFNPNAVALNLAKLYVLKGDNENMFITLEHAAGNGFVGLGRLKSDTEFGDFQNQERFQNMLKKVEINVYPCLGDYNARHFDFWIGEWDVYDNGRKVGDNSITRATGGCAIHENYTTAGNYSGQSINFYSPVDEKWHQHWVGSSGDVYNYVETKKADGMLEFVSDFMTPQGNLTLSRLTFLLNEDGTVRQLFESSSDNGATWSPSFDGLYKRKSGN